MHIETVLAQSLSAHNSDVVNKNALWNGPYTKFTCAVGCNLFKHWINDMQNEIGKLPSSFYLFFIYLLPVLILLGVGTKPIYLVWAYRNSTWARACRLAVGYYTGTGGLESTIVAIRDSRKYISFNKFALKYSGDNWTRLELQKSYLRNHNVKTRHRLCPWMCGQRNNFLCHFAVLKRFTIYENVILKHFFTKMCYWNMIQFQHVHWYN